MFAVGDRDGAEIRTGGPVFVHVALGDHRHRGGRGAQAVRVGPAVLDTAGVGIDGQTAHHLTETEFRALVEGTVGDDHLGHARRDRQGGLLDGRRRSAAAVPDLAEELQIPDPGGPRHRGLQVGIHCEGHQAVDIGGGQARIVERVEHRLGGQPQLAAAGVLGEVGGADAGDRCFSG